MWTVDNIRHQAWGLDLRTVDNIRLEDLSPDHHLGEIGRVPRNSMPPLKIMMIVLGYRVPTLEYSKLEMVMGVSNCCQSSYEWQKNCEGLIADYCTLQSLQQNSSNFFPPEDVVLGPENMAPPHLARQDLNKHWFELFCLSFLHNFYIYRPPNICMWIIKYLAESWSSAN